jgi:ABC transport system ATP-binding/permease protein
MSILSVEDIGISYGPKRLFQSASFGLEVGDKVGLIGINGSGKSTLLKIIAGHEAPDRGRVVIASDKTIAYLSQNPIFDPDQTVLEAVFSSDNPTMRLLRSYETACHELALSPSDERLLERVSELAQQLEVAGAWNLETDARTILSQLGLKDVTAEIGSLSGGERKRVALAHALVSKPDLLILDEPTNHLDADTISWFETYLTRYPSAVLLVTHDRYFLDRVTTRILELDRERVQGFNGNYAYYLEKKEEQEEQRAQESEKQRALLKRELAWLRRGAKARSTKQKARVQRVEALREQTPGIADNPDLDITVGFSRMGKKILELRELSMSRGGKELIDGFSYNLKRNDRIGIIGPSGVGKTTLLDLIASRLAPDSGSVEKGRTIVIGYYDQENRELDGSQRVIDYVREIAERIETADGQVITASQLLERFLFPPSMQYDVIERLSGGERRRLYLLRTLMGAPNVLMLDEPTNDLDIATLVRLEEYLDSFAGCLIVVSHDRYFLDRTVESIFHFESGGSIKEYPGNYSAYRGVSEVSTPDVEPPPSPKKEPMQKSETGPRKLSYKQRIEFEELEKRIERTEARKIELEHKLNSAASDFVAVQQAYNELETLKRQLEIDVDRWGELAELA